MGAGQAHPHTRIFHVNLSGKLADLVDRMAGRPSRKRVAADIQNALTNDGLGWDSFFGLGGGTSSVAGIKESETGLLKVPAVRQSILTISGDIACSTLGLHKSEVPAGEDSLQKSHPTNQIVAVKWNEWESAFEAWKRLSVHALLWGNGYAYISRDRRGRINWMMNLAPGACHPHNEVDPESGKAVSGYMITLDENEPAYFVEPGVIYHLRGLSIDNDQAEDAITYLRDTASVYLGAQKFEGSFFANGAQSGGIITIPPGVPTEARERLENQIQKKALAENWFKTMVLRDGAQWHQTTVDARSAEMIPIKESVVRDVARFFNLPPFKLGVEDSVSYNSSEHAQRAYLTGCLNHWLRAITSEAYIKLLPPSLQASGEYRFEHNVSKLIEPDFKTLNEVLAIQRMNGIITANQWLTKINLPLSTDPSAEELFNPNTQTNAEKTEDKPKDTEEVVEEDDDEEDELQAKSLTTEITNVERRLLQEAVDRATKRICTPVLNRSKKAEKLSDWVDQEQLQNRNLIQDELGTVAEMVFGDDAGNIIQAVSDEFFDTLQREVALCLAMDADKLQDNVAYECRDFSANIHEILSPLFTRK